MPQTHCDLRDDIMQERVFVTGGPSATRALGKRLGGQLPPGAVLALVGELGSGKTCFTKGLCSGLGVPMRQVNSPSYAFVNQYRGRLPVLHLDLYRIPDLESALDLGMLDYVEQARSGVMVVEWAERVLGLASDDWLRVDFTVLSARRREIAFTPLGERASTLLARLTES